MPLTNHHLYTTDSEERNAESPRFIPRIHNTFMKLHKNMDKKKQYILRNLLKESQSIY